MENNFTNYAPHLKDNKAEDGLFEELFDNDKEVSLSEPAREEVEYTDEDLSE